MNCNLQLCICMSLLSTCHKCLFRLILSHQFLLGLVLPSLTPAFPYLYIVVPCICSWMHVHSRQQQPSFPQEPSAVTGKASASASSWCSCSLTTSSVCFTLLFHSDKPSDHFKIYFVSAQKKSSSICLLVFHRL